MLIGVIFAASVAAASPGQFSPTDGIIAPAAPTTAAPGKTAANDTICWTEEPVGSHIPHRYCAPKAYWEQRQRMDREALSHLSSGGASRAVPSGGMSASSGGGSAGP